MMVEKYPKGLIRNKYTDQRMLESVYHLDVFNRYKLKLPQLRQSE